jgi:hypothetical protein
MATGIGQSLVFAILAPLGREVQLAELQITSIIAISALIFGLVAPRWGRLLPACWATRREPWYSPLYSRPG